jgi:hypothetical protein
LRAGQSLLVSHILLNLNNKVLKRVSMGYTY